jgi:hypothetical protein
MDIKKPVKSYKAGAISFNIWENEVGEDTFKSFTFQRAYKDKDDKWQHTQSLKVNDLPKLIALADEAYKDSIVIENNAI